MAADGIPIYDVTGVAGTNPWFVYSAGGPPSSWATGYAASPWNSYIPSSWPANPHINGDQPIPIQFWTETDSGQDNYTELSNYQAACRLMYGTIRTGVSKTAVQMPIFILSPMAFKVGQVAGTGQGYFQRQSFDSFAADGALNVKYCIGNMSDALPNGGTVDSFGTITGGDLAHISPGDHQRYGYLMGLQIGATLIAQGLGDPLGISSVPSGVPVSNGPRVTAAAQSVSNVIRVAVAHDGGTALSAPLKAASGLGWTVMVGGSLAAPGTLYNASGCTVVDATHIDVTFSGLGMPTVGTMLLFYSYGMSRPGPGSLVYDNYASVTPPAGWNPSAIASAAVLNRPLQQVNALAL